MVKLSGRLVVGQSGGPTQVINNSLVGVIEQARRQVEVTDVYGSLRGITGVLEDKLIDLGQQPDSVLAGLRRTPGAALGTVRYKLQSEDYTRIIHVLRSHQVRFFCYIGGNDSMDTAYQVHLAAQKDGYELYCVGVPKTVDNDLACTDHCPGYGSAARFIAHAVRDSGMDTESMGSSSPVKIVEIMGRNAGWLTAAAALARRQDGDPPHLIYVPERPVDEQSVVEDVRRTIAQRGHCVIALSEGTISDVSTGEVDAFGHRMKGGAAEYLSQVISEQLGLKVRLDRPNYLQRSFMATLSAVDADEAYLVGQTAVTLATAGVSGVMVTLQRETGDAYRCTTGTAPLDRVANAERFLPDRYINAQGNDVTAAFLEYARPLIGEPIQRLARLEHLPVPARAGVRTK